MNFKTVFNNSIIIAPNELRDYFVLLKNDNLNLDFKFFTKEEVLTNLFGTFNEKAIAYLMKEMKYSFSMSKKYLTYITHGATKLPFDIDLLTKNNLLYKDEYYKKLYSKSHILFVNYVKDDLEIKHIINELGLNDYEFIQISDLIFLENNKEYFALEN